MILGGLQGAKVVETLSREMSRSDWISFSKEFRTSSADNLVLWHMLHKKEKLEREWPLSAGTLSLFKVAVRELAERRANGNDENN